MKIVMSGFGFDKLEWPATHSQQENAARTGEGVQESQEAGFASSLCRHVADRF